MRKSSILVLFLMISITLVSVNVRADHVWTDYPPEEILMAWIFYQSQHYSLKGIARQYPSLSDECLVAEKEFVTEFKLPGNSLDAFMLKHGKELWIDYKKLVDEEFMRKVESTEISEQDARQYIRDVRDRANGKIDSPELETLRLFNPVYSEQPELEFTEGYKKRHFLKVDDADSDVTYSIEVPKTWINGELMSPDLINTFHNQWGRGDTFIAVKIDDHSLLTRLGRLFGWGAETTPPGMRKMAISPGSTYIDGGNWKSDHLSGFWLEFMSKSEGKDPTHTIMYIGHSDSKTVSMVSMPLSDPNEVKQGSKGDLNRYRKLFRLMAESFEINDKN